MNAVARVMVLLVMAGAAAPGATGVRYGGDDGSVPLPLEGAGTGKTPERQMLLASAPAWKEFTSRHGAWSVLWNEATGTPHRAFGPSFPVSLRPPASAEDARAAALAFIRDHAGLLGVDPGQLRFVRATPSRGKWYVSFVQTHGGRDVLLSEVEIRLSADGRLMAFGADCYTGIDAPASPVLSPADAERAALAGLEASATLAVKGEGTLRILPLTRGEQTGFHLVYEVLVDRASPPGRFVTYVDAADGTVLWRRDRVRYQVQGRAEGTVQLTLPTDPFTVQPFSSLHVLIGGVRVTSDSTGAFSGAGTDSVTVSAALSGPSVNVNRADGPDAQIMRRVVAGDSVLIRWDGTSAQPSERDAFFHTNIIHDFITRLDPQFTAISYSMPCAVNISQTCNAFWDGTGINFFREGDGCPNTAQMPDVVYHEYGHGINDRLYEQLGQPWGMINSAVHEGMADVAAAMILDDPRVGRGFFGPGTILRTLVNTAKYPRDVSSDPHITGLILAGAFWDLRIATSIQTMRELAHFAKYGLPDDPADGAAFSEWFVETLVADDDNGNLADGTPHSPAIVAAFESHNIGPGLFYQRSFSHTPLPNTSDTTTPYTAVFTLTGIPGFTPDSIRLWYSVDGFATRTPIPAATGLPGVFEAAIPPQPSGTIVRYFVSASDPLSGNRYAFPANAPDSGSYRFLVGRQQVEPGVLYATASGARTAILYRMNPATGTAAPLGPLGVATVHALAVHPVTKELYAFSSGGSKTRTFRVSPTAGDAFEEQSIPLVNVRAATFAGGDTIYLADASNRLYRSVNGDTVFIGTAAGLSYASLAYRSLDGSLWASVRPLFSLRDRIYLVDRSTGQVTLVGATGDNLPTPAIAFGPDGVLYALKGTFSQINSLLRLDPVTAAGTSIGSAGVSGLATLAGLPDSVQTSVQESPAAVPYQAELAQNYPNPFNGQTVIGYSVPDDGTGSPVPVTIRIFDVLGREVAILLQERKLPGSHSLSYTAGTLPSGVYLCRLEIGNRGAGGALLTRTRKMLLLR